MQLKRGWHIQNLPRKSESGYILNLQQSIPSTILYEPLLLDDVYISAYVDSSLLIFAIAKQLCS